MAITLSGFALALSTLALFLSIVLVGRARQNALKAFDDPTRYTVVTDGKFYRVRGPFDTFYTIRFHDRSDAQKYAEQLAAWNHRRHELDEGKWRAVA